MTLLPVLALGTGTSLVGLLVVLLIIILIVRAV